VLSPARIVPIVHEDVVPGPVLLRQLELSSGFTDLTIPRSRTGASYSAVALLVRLHRRPLGLVTLTLNGEEAVDAVEVAERVFEQLHAEIKDHLVDDAVTGNGGGLEPTVGTFGSPPCAYERVLDDRAIPVSVVVTTCNRTDTLGACLRSIFASSYPHFEVIVIENRPVGSRVADSLADAFPGEKRLRYVEEPKRGLANARNRGIREARGKIVVFTDDDVVVDRYWLAHLVEAFVATSASCVTGLILPAELETPAQRYLEEFGGYAKGFRSLVYEGAEREADPLYPYAAGRFGSGANTALLTSVARELGGFDPDLGAGRPSAGGEDLDIYIRLLRQGCRLAYTPDGIVWHRHHADLPTLARQLFHYGEGLAAALTKQLVNQPRRGDLVRRIPRGAAHLVRRDSSKNSARSSSYPGVLVCAEMCGLAMGPAAYVWTSTTRWW
jgi:GT2 family glycosyltransferase